MRTLMSGAAVALALAVTAAQAQQLPVSVANQGRPGALGWPVFAGQYNASLPTLASGATGYVALDASGRIVLAPGASVAVNNFPATQPVSGTVAVSNAFLLDATLTARLGTLGQKAAAGSAPVVLASDQPSIPVAATLQAGSATIGSLANIGGTISLPTGASTAAAQATGNASLSSIDGKLPAAVNGRLPVDGSAVTQPVSAAALPLPAGAATAANQGTGNTALASIDAKTPALVSGRQPVDGSGVTQPVSAAALPLPAGAATAAGQSAVQAAPGTSAGTAQAVQGVAGGLPVATTLRSAGTNRSATVGTTAVTLMPANPTRAGYLIKNDTAGDLWCNLDATATAAPGSGNIRIAAGAYLSSEPGFVSTNAMSCIGSAAGLAITAREH